MDAKNVTAKKTTDVLAWGMQQKDSKARNDSF